MPIIIPPLIKVALVAIGGVAAVHWMLKEFRRINRELDGMKAGPAGEPVHHQELPTLRRDPASGEWRPV
jgi:hypothetical protein